MYTAATQIKEAFACLEQGKFDRFAEILYGTLLFMAIQGMISHKTLHRVSKRLLLRDGELYAESNPDGTSTVYKKDKMIDTFQIHEVSRWLLNQLIQDEMIQNNNLISNVQEFYKNMSNMFLPDRWYDSFGNYEENMIHPIHANGNIYYLQKTPWGSYVLKKLKSKLEYAPNLDAAETIIEGLEPEIEYVPKQNSLYCRIKGLDAYVCYHIKKEEKLIVYQAELIGVNTDGTEWYRNREGVLCSYSQGKLRRHKDVSPESCLTVCQEGIKVFPTVFGGDTYYPYMLNANGESASCSYREIGQWLWNRILLALIGPNEKQENNMFFSEAIQQEALSKTPFPFTSEQIIKKIEGIQKVRLDEKHRLLRLIEQSEKKGLVAVFYKSWRTPKHIPSKKRMMLSGKIGSFTEEEGKLLTDFDTVLNGEIQGNRICRRNIQRYEGEVYYDLEFQEYVLVWNGEQEFKWKEELETLIGTPVLFVEEPETPEEAGGEDDEDTYMDPDEIEKWLEKLEAGDLPF